MKAVIAGKSVNVRVVENLGYNHNTGMQMKVVEFEGRYLTIQNRFGVWMQRTPADRVDR